MRLLNVSSMHLRRLSSDNINGEVTSSARNSLAFDVTYA